jgi:CheY-like chemotaxis protein
MSALLSTELYARHGDRILVVDDNPAIHEDFRKILTPTWAVAPALSEAAAGFFGKKTATAELPAYVVDSTLRGEDALALARSACEQGRPYAMAFVDMRMPNGWNGLQTIEQLWRLQSDLPVVLCTAFSDFSWEEIRNQLGRSDRFLILKKPFDHIEVQQMVDAMLMRHVLQARTRWLDLCLAHLPEMVMVLQASGGERPLQGLQMVFVNQAFERTLGYSSAELLARSPDVLWETGEPAELQAAASAPCAEIEAPAWRLKGRDGRLVQARFELLPVAPAGGRASHLVCLQRLDAPVKPGL